MAYASVTYTSASGTTFALTNSNGDPIPYIRQSDIKVYVNTVLQTLTTDYTFNTAGTAIVLNSAVSGATVLLQRITDITDPTVVYTAGSTLTAQDLNNADNQIRYGLQEFQDSVQAGGGVPDGDKGDIVVGGTGTIWSIDAGAVTEGKIASGAVTETKIGTGAVTSTKIANDTIVDADINANAEIAVSKLADGTARQLLQTDAAGTGVEWTSNVDVPGTLDVTGNTTLDGNLTVGGSFDVTSLNGGPLAGTRNRIINGDMRIAQRGTAAVTVNSEYPVDRWLLGYLTSGAVSAQYETASVPVGFQSAIKLITTTADATTDAGDLWYIQQWIEGFNAADLLFGTANAKTVTLSFWVRSSVTGTFCVTLLNYDGAAVNRSYVSEYTINVADTWEYKTITVPGDTSGTWLKDSGRGMAVRLGLTAGTNFQQAAGSWSTGNVVGSANQTQLLETLNATWYVTGVQLEAGTVATPFERRSYGQELALCQRYYYRTPDGFVVMRMAGYSVNARAFGQMFTHPQTMRTSPTIVTSGVNYSGTNTLTIDFARESHWSAYAISAADNSNYVYFNFTASAEL